VVDLVDLEKCIRQLVLTVEKNAKFHSNLLKVNPYTVESVIKNTENIELSNVHSQ